MSRPSTASFSPDAGASGILPQLYRHALGPLNATYYQACFERFEAHGRSLPTWNTAAAFGAIGWLCLRRLWLAAAGYAGVLVLCAAVWWWTLRGHLPWTAQLSLWALIALVLVLALGFLGNALYYRTVHQRTLQALEGADTLAQAAQQLQTQAVTRQRAQTVAAIGGASVVLLLACALHWGLEGVATHPDQRPATAPVGPPTLHFPQPSPPATAEAGAAAAAAAPTPSPPLHALPAPATTPPLPPVTTPAADPVSAPTATDRAAPAAPLPSPAAEHPVPTPAPAPSPAPTPAAAQAQAPLEVGRYYLNVGLYAQASNADQAEQLLHAAGLPVLRRTLPERAGHGPRIQLRSGPFATREAAISAQRHHAIRVLETSVFQHRAKGQAADHG